MQNSWFSLPASRRLALAAMLGGLGMVAPLSLGVSTPSVAAQSLFARAPVEGFSDLVEKVMPAVVSVEARSGPKPGEEASARDPFGDLPKDSPFRQFFENFPNKRFAMPFSGKRPRSISQGSGFFISADGYLVTNHHVIKDADEIVVRHNSGKEYKAKVVGVDPKTDLALLKVSEAHSFAFVSFAPKEPRVGDWVVAVGNPFGLGGTVTTGIVSARGRDIGSGPYDDFIQIDAPINRGNSGGPAFNLEGEVIGINTAIYSPSGGSVGIGFAIPATEAMHVISSLKAKGSVTRGWLGVQIQPVTQDIADASGLKDAQGALIADVLPHSPALSAGLKAGDVVLSLNGEGVKDSSDLARRVARLDPKSKALLSIVRGGKPLSIAVYLEAMPADKDLATRQEEGAKKSEFLGLTFEAAPDHSGVVISSVQEGSEAEMRGLKVGDIVMRIGGVEVDHPSVLVGLLSDMRKNGHRVVLLLVKTGEMQRFVALPLQGAP